MTVTRANIESILVQRCGALMSFAGMAITSAGANASLNDPIGYALRQTGYTVGNVANVADSDLATLDVDDLDQILDVAEYRTLENIGGNLDDVDITNGPESERFSQLSTALEKRMTRLEQRITDLYGIASLPETGSITFDFAEHDDSDITT